VRVVPGTGTGIFTQISYSLFASMVKRCCVQVVALGMKVVVNDGVTKATAAVEVVIAEAIMIYECKFVKSIDFGVWIALGKS
jgi:hypothetical protein